MYSGNIIQQFKDNGYRMNLQSFVNSAYFCKHKVLYFFFSWPLHIFGNLRQLTYMEISIKLYLAEL